MVSIENADKSIEEVDNPEYAQDQIALGYLIRTYRRRCSPRWLGSRPLLMAGTITAPCSHQCPSHELFRFILRLGFSIQYFQEQVLCLVP